jgi:hypothetical protein
LIQISQITSNCAEEFIGGAFCLMILVKKLPQSKTFELVKLTSDLVSNRGLASTGNIAQEKYPGGIIASLVDPIKHLRNNFLQSRWQTSFKNVEASPGRIGHVIKLNFPAGCKGY